MHTWRTDAEASPGPWLQEVVRSLAAGGVVALPTDTFYGLAADSRSAVGIARVLQLKGRSPKHPLLLLVADCAAARQLAPAADSRLEELAAHFWPGPLTVVLPTAGRHLPNELVGPTAGVAVRVPGSVVARRVARALGAPITGTSANRTGTPPAMAADDIDLDARLLDGVVDAGVTPGELASTVVDLTGAWARVVRAGAIPNAAISKSLDGRLV